MKRTKEQKGITLIALIITIVVLMVLAAVAISSIQNDGIIGHAQNATNKFTEEQQKEQDMLNYYELVLSGKAWTQNKTTVSRGTDTFKVGEKVTLKATGDTTAVAYSAGDYTGDWVVLGAKYGKLLLVSATNVKNNVGLYGANGGTYNGTTYEAGYYNGPDYLDGLCSTYLNSKYADSARSITLEDLDRLVGYVPAAGTTYTITAETLAKYGLERFVHVDGREIGKNGVTSIQVTDTTYSWDTWTLGYNSLAHSALFDNTDDGTGSYWTSTRTVMEPSLWGLATVGEEYYGRGVLWAGHYAEPAMRCDRHGARAVVSIKPDIQVEKVVAEAN